MMKGRQADRLQLAGGRGTADRCLARLNVSLRVCASQRADVEAAQ